MWRVIYLNNKWYATKAEDNKDKLIEVVETITDEGSVILFVENIETLMEMGLPGISEEVIISEE